MPTNPCLGVVEGQFGASTGQFSSSPLPPGDSVPDRNSCTCGSKTGGSPRSPPADWNQSTVSSELLDNEKQFSPSMGCVRSTVSVVSSKSLHGEGKWSPSTRQDQSANLRVISGLESKFVSSKVTHHLGRSGLRESIQLLGHTGLGESICLLAASPGQPSAGSVCSWAGQQTSSVAPGMTVTSGVSPASWLPDCLLLQLPYCAQEMEQLSHSMCPSSMAAAVSAWWW